MGESTQKAVSADTVREVRAYLSACAGNSDAPTQIYKDEGFRPASASYMSVAIMQARHSIVLVKHM